MPVDFTGNPAAFVEMGDGGAHDPQLRVTAPDNSCAWNDFPICISYPGALDCGSERIASPAYQLLPFITTPGGGTSGPTAAQWPRVYVYDYLTGLVCGKTLEARIRFNAHGTTSVGSVGIFEEGDGVCGAKPGPILGDYDSGWFAISCQDCTLAPDNLSITVGFSNFNPVPPAQVQIDNGILEVRWVAGAPTEVYGPNQDPYIAWRPECWVELDSMTDLPAGMWIALGTNSCGQLNQTYTQLANAINALDLGPTASVIGGHGADIVTPDPACPIETHLLRQWYCCPMDGAICSGTAGDTPGG